MLCPIYGHKTKWRRLRRPSNIRLVFCSNTSRCSKNTFSRIYNIRYRTKKSLREAFFFTLRSRTFHAVIKLKRCCDPEHFTNISRRFHLHRDHVNFVKIHLHTYVRITRHRAHDKLIFYTCYITRRFSRRKTETLLAKILLRAHYFQVAKISVKVYKTLSAYIL